MAYWRSKGLNRGGKREQPNPCKWCKSTVAKILAQQEYCGDIINFKTYSKSFKNKARLENPEENWVIFKNVHEPIIDRDTFAQVQTILGKTKRRAPKAENGEKNMFADLLYCADCGHKLWYHTNTINKEIHFFSCSNYAKDYRGSCQTRHYIRADAIEQVVTQELRRLAQYLRCNEEEFADLLNQKTNADMEKEQKYAQTELRKCVSRQEKVAALYEKLYEDNADGKVTDEWYLHMAHKYEMERMELKSRAAELQEKLRSIGEMKQNKDSFLAAIRKFMQMETLTAPILRELIEKIEVHEIEGTGRNRTQRVIMHYRFVGCIALPDSMFRENLRENTRKGVELEYQTA